VIAQSDFVFASGNLHTAADNLSPAISISTHAAGTVSLSTLKLNFDGGSLDLAWNGHLYTGTSSFGIHTNLHTSCWKRRPLLRYHPPPPAAPGADPPAPAAPNAPPTGPPRPPALAECPDPGGMALTGGALAYPSLSGWNLRGAIPPGARLSFASLYPT